MVGWLDGWCDCCGWFLVACGWFLVGWLKWLVGCGWLVGWLVRQVVVGLWFHGTGNRSRLFSQLESLVGFLGYVYPVKSGEKFI